MKNRFVSTSILVSIIVLSCSTSAAFAKDTYKISLKFSGTCTQFLPTPPSIKKSSAVSLQPLSPDIHGANCNAIVSIRDGKKRPRAGVRVYLQNFPFLNDQLGEVHQKLIAKSSTNKHGKVTIPFTWDSSTCRYDLSHGVGNRNTIGFGYIETTKSVSKDPSCLFSFP